MPAKTYTGTMPERADVVYARRAWNDFVSRSGGAYSNTPGFAPDGSQGDGPFPMNDDRVNQDRLLAALYGQPPQQTRPLFRPRYGYDMSAIGIEDVLGMEMPDRELYPVPMAGNPGGPASIDGGTRDSYTNTLGGA